MQKTNLSTTAHRLDHIWVVEEEGTGQGDTVRVVGGSILEGHIQGLHCVLGKRSLGLAPAAHMDRLSMLRT